MRTAQDAKLSCITRQPIPEHDNTQDARNTRPNRAKHMPTINGPREWTEKGFLAPADEATAIDKNRADKREQTRCNRWRGAHYGSVVLADILIAQHPPCWGEPWRPFSLAPLFIFLDYERETNSPGCKANAPRTRQGTQAIRNWSARTDPHIIRQ